jgi:LAGLIDADG DNA endonuclease family
LIKNHLTGRGLAFWFMDNGSKLDYNKNSVNKGLVLNTHSFTRENIIVKQSESYNKFINLTYEYIYPSMRYKLSK